MSHLTAVRLLAVDVHKGSSSGTVLHTLEIHPQHLVQPINPSFLAQMQLQTRFRMSESRILTSAVLSSTAGTISGFFSLTCRTWDMLLQLAIPAS